MGLEKGATEGVAICQYAFSVKTRSSWRLHVIVTEVSGGKVPQGDLDSLMGPTRDLALTFPLGAKQDPDGRKDGDRSGPRRSRVAQKAAERGSR